MTRVSSAWLPPGGWGTVIDGAIVRGTGLSEVGVMQVFVIGSVTTEHAISLAARAMTEFGHGGLLLSAVSRPNEFGVALVYVEDPDGD